MEENNKILERLFLVASKGLTHKHYKRTVEKRKEYRQLVAGVGIDDLLRQFIRREDEVLFKQRVNLTHHIVTSVCENLITPFYKIPRSNSARPLIAYQDEDKGANEKRQELLGVLGKFWGDKSWDDYMSTRYIELNAIDPNSFLVFEFKDFDNETELVSPYPYEATAEMAIDFGTKNNILEYLIVKDAHRYKLKTQEVKANEFKKQLPDPKKEYKTGHKYTLYTRKNSYRISQCDTELRPDFAGLVEGAVVQGQENQYVRLGEKLFIFEEFAPHGLKHVPALRVGYKRDLATDGATFVSMIEPVVPFLKKSVTVNSHLDLVATLIAMPQQIRVAEKCEHTGCYNGKLENGTTCPSCHGTGLKATAPSAQDAVLIKMPRDREEMIPLSEVIRYIHPPVDIVKWQQEYVEELTQKAKTILYNSDTFTRKQVSETATGKYLDMQNVYDTLHPFTVAYSRGWAFGVRTVAELADRAKNLIVALTFGKDYKFKTLDMLIADLTAAEKMNNPALIRHINEDIAQIIFAEKPLEKQRYELQQFFSPFQGKSEKEVTLLLASDLVLYRDKVLHANFGGIIDAIELDAVKDRKSFYSMTREEQKAIIYEKVDEIIAALEEERPSPLINLDDERQAQ